MFCVFSLVYLFHRPGYTAYQSILDGIYCRMLNSPITLFVAGDHECWGVFSHDAVCEDGVEKLGHISDVLLEDAAVHHKHYGSATQHGTWIIPYKKCREQGGCEVTRSLLTTVLQERQTETWPNADCFPYRLKLDCHHVNVPSREQEPIASKVSNSLASNYPHTSCQNLLFWSIPSAGSQLL